MDYLADRHAVQHRNLQIKESEVWRLVRPGCVVMKAFILPQKRGLTKDENRAGCTTP